MADCNATRLRQFLGRLWFLGLILVLSMLFVVEAMGFRGDAWKFPTVVGATTAILSLFELLRSLREQPVELPGLVTEDRSRPLILTVWFLSTLAALYVLGVLPAVALSVSVYFYAFVWQRLVWSFTAGLGHAFFFWVAFELLAGFRLYEGVL